METFVPNPRVGDTSLEFRSKVVWSDKEKWGEARETENLKETVTRGSMPFFERDDSSVECQPTGSRLK